MKTMRSNRRAADWKRLFGLGLLLAALPAAAFAAELPVAVPADAGLQPDKLAAVDAFMEKQVADKKIAGGVVAIARYGKVGFLKAYGKQDLEADKAMQPDTIFRLYSMSKAITTAAALTLVDAGKIGLDDPVSKYIPSFKDLQVAGPDGLRAPSRAMTVKDLMLHISGLSYGSGPDAHKEAYSRLKPLESKDLAEMAEKLAKVPLAHDPGADWTYSVSTDVLGRIVEVASGEPLDVYLQKAIFDPLDMKDTGFHVPAEKLPRFAANYSRSPEGLKLIDDPAKSKYAKPTTFFSGGGGLVGTARDYLRFLAMVWRGGELDGKRVLMPKTVALMTSNQLPKEAFPIHFGKEKRHGVGFGLGFSVRVADSEWDPAGHVGEYGWGGAASTHYWSSPEDRLTVVTLEQIMPYQWDTEFGLKKPIYEALAK